MVSYDPRLFDFIWKKLTELGKTTEVNLGYLFEKDGYVFSVIKLKIK